MAGDNSFDAYLCFGPVWKSGRLDGKKLNGESPDMYEKELNDNVGLGKSMAIQSYSLGFAIDRAWGEEAKRAGQKDKQSHAPTCEGVKITKLVDSASPQLLVFFWNAVRFENAWICQRKAGGMRGKAGDYFLEIQLLDVHVTNLTWSASQAYPTEEFTLGFTSFTACYTPQSNTGALLNSVDTGGDPLVLDRPQDGESGGLSDQSSATLQKLITELKNKKILATNFRG